MNLLATDVRFHSDPVASYVYSPKIDCQQPAVFTGCFFIALRKMDVTARRNRFVGAISQKERQAFFLEIRATLVWQFSMRSGYATVLW